MYDLKIDVHFWLLLGAPFHIGGLVRDVRLSCGAGLAIRLGIAQIELNYSVPLRARATDRCVCVICGSSVCVCQCVHLCVCVSLLCCTVYMFCCVLCVCQCYVSYVCISVCFCVCVCLCMLCVCLIDLEYFPLPCTPFSTPLMFLALF